MHVPQHFLRFCHITSSYDSSANIWIALATSNLEWWPGSHVKKECGRTASDGMLPAGGWETDALEICCLWQLPHDATSLLPFQAKNA